MRRLPILALLSAGCPSDQNLNDAGDPAISMANPERAGWLDAGATDADGDYTAVSAITVNGESAVESPGVLGGTWSGEVVLPRGISVVEARGEDVQGDGHYVKNGVIAGEFLSPHAPVSDAATIRLNEEGLDVVLDAAAARFDGPTVEAALVANNPIYSGEFLEIAGTDVFAIDLNVDAVAFTSLDLHAEPAIGQLDFGASLYDLDVATELVIEILGSDFLDPIVVDVLADRVDLTGAMVLGASDGDLTVTILSSNVSIAGFYFDTTLIPSSIEGDLLSGAVEAVLEDRIGVLIEDRVAALVQEQLSSLDLSFESEVLDHTVSVEAEFADAGVDPAGVSITMDIDVDVDGDTEHPYQGYLTAPGDPPSPDATADLSLSLWDDLLNKMLFASWRGGMLNRTLSTEDGSLDPVALLPLHAEEGTITIDAWLPPVIVESESGLQGQFAEILVTVDTPGGELGEHLVASVAMFVDVDLVVEAGEIKVEIDDPTLNLMVRESDWGASDVTVTNALQEALPVDLLLAVVGDLAFPLPDLYGIEMAAATGRDGNGTHTTVRVALSLAN